jgi:hypothetical protein
MNGTTIQYLARRRELLRELARDALVHGLVAPLAFLWSVGLGLFSIVWWSPLLAVGWTAAVAALGTGMFASHIRHAESLRRSLLAILARRLHAEKIGDRELRGQLEHSIGLVVDIAARVSVLEDEFGEESSLRRVLVGAHDMLVLHSRAAHAAELAGGRDCALGREVTRELASTARQLDLAVTPWGRDIAFTAHVADQQDQFLDSLRTGTLAVDGGLDVALAGTDHLAAGGLAVYSGGEYLPATVQRQGNTLHSGFTRIQNDAGLRALQQLAYQYAGLLPVLERKRAAEPLAIAHVPLLALETYRQGLSVLNDAFELTAAVHSPERHRLEREAGELQREIAEFGESDLDSPRLTMKVEALASHRERLDIMRQYELRIEELLHYCGRCEASLDRARMELAALKSESSTASVTLVTTTLKATIEEARSVQDELKRLAL